MRFCYILLLENLYLLLLNRMMLYIESDTRAIDKHFLSVIQRHSMLQV